MSKEVKFELYLIGAIMLLILGWMVFASYRQKLLVNETILRTESEMRFKQLVKDNMALAIQKDSILLVNSNLDKVIARQKRNPKIIIKKVYEKHISISNLDNDSSVILFTNNARRYSLQRHYYSLSRFDK